MKKKLIYFFIIFMVIFNITMPIEAASASRRYSKSVRNSGYLNKIITSSTYKIPNAYTNFVPQGLCKVTYNGNTYRLITAYHYKKSKNSQIYVINSKGKHIKTIKISNSKGAHVGGITEYKNSIWIVSTSKIYKISVKKLLSAADNSTIKPSILTSKNISASKKQGNLSFCTSYNGYLWIGTYNAKGSAKAYAYTYNSSKNKLVHKRSMTIPKKCQGMCFQDSKTVFLSTSIGKIYKYKCTTSGSTVKLSKKLKTITVPTYAQEIYLTKNNNLFILFESCATPYYKKASSVEDRVVLYDL